MDEHEDFEGDEGGPGMVFPFVLGEIPPEVKQQIQERRDRHEMAAEVWRHEVNDLLHALSPEQLGTIRSLLQTLDAQTISYYIGVITTLLEVKHGRCGGCGKNHEEDLLVLGQEVHDKDMGGQPDD